jgi:hypothetical protein
MSNAYINQVIFGNSKEQVDEEYVRELLPLMLTDERMKRFQTNIHADSPNALVPENVPEKKEIVLETTARKPRFQQQKNSLFWSIYELEHPEEAFLGTKANAEVDHRLKVVASLKTTPKRLKETNSKLTIEQTQALLGSMLVAKEDKLDFCIAYAAYYNKPIIVVYEKTYCVFSPMVDVDVHLFSFKSPHKRIEDSRKGAEMNETSAADFAFTSCAMRNGVNDDDVILLYASKPDSARHIIYEAEKTATPELISGIMKTRVMGPLRSMSSYKTQELDEIAAMLHVPTKQTDTDDKGKQKEKRRKKEDVYNDIKVVIHRDMNFICENMPV